jgi:predicted esterase
VQGKTSVSPNGKKRNIELYVSDAAKDLDGPLVFFWHGAGGSPTEASYALGKTIDAIKALGGIVAAPYHDPGSGQLPWFLALGGTKEDDLFVADEILACAIEKVGIDKRHIHSVGFSAGAMQTEQFAARRSGYLASIVAYSGARLGVPVVQDESNKYAAMLFHGGASDQVIINFQTSTKTYYEDLTMEGHFAFACNHDKGHTVPSDGRNAAWQFLQDHPFGVSPEPYEKGLPMGFPELLQAGSAAE